MRRTKNLFPAVCFAALAGSGCAQVLSPPEIQDPNMRALQEKHLTELKTVGTVISAHRFPYRLYFSRALDLNEQQQQRRDQRAIRFEEFRNQTVLEITANYYASYSAELMQKEERALRTMQDVMVPILQAAVPALGQEEKLQAFALEISHHVRRKVLGVSTESAENVAFILPRLSAKRLISATTPGEQQAALMQGLLFVDGKPVDGWSRGNAERMAYSKPQPLPLRVDAKPAVGESVIESPAPQTPPSVALSAPPAMIASETKQGVGQEILRKQQSSSQETLDRLVRELDKDAHFVSYAPPNFIEFHKGVYLELSITTTLRETVPGSQYRVAALAFDEHVAHLIRPILTSLKTPPDFDGIDFSTSMRLAGVAGTSAGAVEFIFPTAALLCYERYDCTGQQLINQGFVLINGERVSLDLQSAER
jgi:hypothetical protein